MLTVFSLVSCAPRSNNSASSDAANGNNMWVMILIYVLIFAAIYFFMLRPNSKKRKQEQAMRDNLEIGDEITTIGGITGRVVSIKEDSDSFILETGTDRCRIQFKRWAISTINTVKDEPKKEDSGEAAEKSFLEKFKSKDKK